MKWRISLLVSLALVMLMMAQLSGDWSVQAQGADATPLPTQTPTLSSTAVPQLTVTGAEPNQAFYGQEVILTVLGSNFSPQTTVRLQGFGVLQSEFVSDFAIRATVPANILPGSYSVDVRDPARGQATLPGFFFTVMAPTATPRPTDEPRPTDMPRPTSEPSTPVPGQPSLVIRNFSVAPMTVVPGDSATISFEVVNRGNRTAQGVSVALSTSSTFVPANGMSSIVTPDIGAGGQQYVSFGVVVPLDAAAGPNSVSFTMAYRDFSGQTYTSDSIITVMVAVIENVSQVVMSRYWIDSDPVMPGEPVKVTVEIANAGTKTASQVLLRTTEGILLAGPEGDTFSLGDILPGERLVRTLDLVVSRTAEFGPQPQPLVITYAQNGESLTVNTSLTLDVERVVQAEPLLLLASYDIGEQTILRPGQEFTLTAHIRNVGQLDIQQALAVFGNVEADSGDGNNPPPVAGSVFAPIGSGGSHYVQQIVAGEDAITLSQDFIVSGSADSGIYNLPITIVYEDHDGETVQSKLSASLIVVAPPRVQVNLQAPVPETVPVGEAVVLPVQVLNVGAKTVNFTSASFTVEGGDVVEGGQIPMRALKTDTEVLLNGVAMANIEGPVTITLTINYIDDLNRLQTIVQTYQTTGFAAEMPPEPPPSFEEPTPEAEPKDDDQDGFVRRFIMGLMGLGS